MGNKNVRLSFQAWKKLRKLKFEEQRSSYTEVFNTIFEALEKGKTDLTEVIVSKKPEDTGDGVSKSDKTIVIDEDIHLKLAHFKQQYMMENDATARGPGAVSISQIVTTLIDKYQEIRGS